MGKEFLRFNFKNKSTGLRFVSFCFALAGILFIYGEITKAKYRSIDDLVFINGPFKDYTDYNAGKTHIFSFRLKNYSNNFIINNDYLHLLQFDSFFKIKDGQNIKVGFLPGSQENINTIGKKIYVYAISGNNVNFLDAKDTIKQYNNKHMLLFGLSLLVCAILAYSYSNKLFKYYEYNAP